MIEIHDDWHYVTLWYVQGPHADYTALAFRRPGSITCEVRARFRHLSGEDDRKHGLLDGPGWVNVPTGHGASPEYAVSLMETIVKTISVHPELGLPGSVVVHTHTIRNGGAILREILAAAPWVPR